MSSLETDLSFEILGTTPTPSFTSVSSPSDHQQVRDGMSSLRLSEDQSPSARRSDIALDVLLHQKRPSAELLRSLPSMNLSVDFPSISSNISAQDMDKLQRILAEHQLLRQNLIRANAQLKTYFAAVEQWQENVRSQRQADQQRIQQLQLENEELQRMKSAMGEQQQQQVVMGGQTVPHETYKKVERQCSQLLAENLQFKDMEQQYKDEITCLRVNQASTEELVRHSQQEVTQARNQQLRQAEELAAVREENSVLVQQAEIYQKDFLAERDARQRMAGEKEEVLQELNRLRMLLAAAPPTSSQPPSTGHCGLVRFTCPNCYAQFVSQNGLSQHLPSCAGR